MACRQKRRDKHVHWDNDPSDNGPPTNGLQANSRAAAHVLQHVWGRSDGGQEYRRYLAQRDTKKIGSNRRDPCLSTSTVIQAVGRRLSANSASFPVPRQF